MMRTRFLPLLLVRVSLLAAFLAGLQHASADTLTMPLTNPLKSFIHRPISYQPFVGRLTRSVTQTYLNRNLIQFMKDVAMVKYQQSSGAPVWQALFLLDDGWKRIVYSEEGSDRVRAWGTDDGVPARNLQWPVALTVGDPNFSTGDRNVPLYVTEMGRILKLNFGFEAHTLSFVDSLSLDSDSLGLLWDGDLDDNGTPGNPSDDSLWVLDKAYFRLNQYSCAGSHGVKRFYQIPYGSEPGQVTFPRRLALGRNANGSKSNEVYILEMTGRLQRFRLGAGQLVPDGVYEYIDPWTRTNAGFSDVTIDRWGQIYVATSDTNARILKLNHDFAQLAIYDRSGFGADEIYESNAISNPRRSIDYPGWSELLIGETWSAQSGGQAFTIGVAASSGGYHVDPSTPNTVQLSYFATDPHNLRLEPYRWDSTVQYWFPLTPVQYFKYSGLTNDVYWSAGSGPCGNVADYKFVLRLTSTYNSFVSDTLVIQATLGDGGGIHLLEPLTLGQYCYNYYQQSFARWRAQPSPCVGGTLTYTWSTTFNSLRFYVNGVEYMTYTGTEDSLGVRVLPPLAGSAKATSDLPAYVVRADIVDRQGHRLYATKVVDYCSCPGCPNQGDVNNDSFVDIFDVIGVVDIAFSGGPDIQDPNCPTTRGDVVYDTFVDVLDVLRIVDIAISGGIADDPCAP